MTRHAHLLNELERLRRGYRRGLATRCLLAAAVAVLLLFLAFATLDLAFQLPPALCWLAWSMWILTGVAGVATGWRVLHRRLGATTMALLVERHCSGADNHLVNAVQLASALPEAPWFVDELLSETAIDLAQLEAHDLYSRQPQRLLMRALGGMAVVASLLFLLSPRGASRAALRLLAPMAGLPPYTLTRIEAVLPGDVNVLRGDGLNVVVRFSGAPPRAARVLLERDQGRVEVIPLQPLAAAGALDSGMYSAEIGGIFKDGAYRVAGGDARSVRFRVAVIAPPGLERWAVEVMPPDYTGRPSFRSAKDAVRPEIPVGSTVVFGGEASVPLRQVTVLQGERTVVERPFASAARSFAVRFDVADAGPIRFRLGAESGLEATVPFPVTLVLDQRPSVVLVDTGQRMLAAAAAQVPIGFRAEDDYGVIRAGLERLLPEEKTEDVGIAEVSGRMALGRFLVDLRALGAREGDTFLFRVWVEDNGPDAAARRGRSAVVQVAVPRADERREARQTVAAQAADSVQELIRRQRENLRLTRRLAEQAAMARAVPGTELQTAADAQAAIRKLAIELLGNRSALGDLAGILAGLVSQEMRHVVERFEAIPRATDSASVAALLLECVTLEGRILAALLGMPERLPNEHRHQARGDLFGALRKLVTDQRQTLEKTKATQTPDGVATVSPELVREQDRLAVDLTAFGDLCMIVIAEQAEDDFAAQVRAAYDLLEARRTYATMLVAAEALEAANGARAMQAQEEALEALLRALDILNRWRAENAKRIVADAMAVIRDTALKLADMEAAQSRIVEVTKDLVARGPLDDEARQLLRSMDEEQKDMGKLAEALAQDLYQFPELPVCNELNSKMREIFEDVEQALDSENAPAVEIAVQKEDALLDAIRNTKERVEDIEMWLPDVPDNIVWNMESFDTDEFPDMPLVPLPDELEDIVGELLAQAAEIEAESQDTTGNNMIADMEMGWAIMDGPMPSFAAKGKSGNMRPNDNEMTGRSGAGREGQASGELVENHVKGLEGRETAARRTRDPFQKGMVTEAEDSTLDARATGGGKLGGESESIGMFGNAPRRDLHTASHGTTPTALRRETEALYATARLLYLGTGGLGVAARELRGIETAAYSMQDFGNLHRRVLRRLQDTRVELDGGVVLPMPVATVSRAGGAVVEDVDISRIADEYRDVVSDYYRSLGTSGE